MVWVKLGIGNLHMVTQIIQLLSILKWNVPKIVRVLVLVLYTLCGKVEKIRSILGKSENKNLSLFFNFQVWKRYSRPTSSN